MDTVWQKRFVWAWSVLCLVRLISLITLPLDLSADESYYWDWSRHLAWGYYSKPPLIAWLNWLFSWGPHSDTWVRFPAWLMGSLVMGMMYRLGQEMHSAKVGFWAAILFGLTPGCAVLQWVMTIDAPFLLAWVCALHFFWRASNTNRNWPYLAIALILGALAKQMMLVFPLLMLLYAAWNQHDLLRNYRFWLAWMTPLLGMLPTLLWNLNNSWITLLHTEHHFQARGGGMLSVAELLAGQLGSLGPVLGGLVLVYLARSFTRSRHLDRAQRFLFCFCGPALLVFLVLSLRQRINANWPAAFYLPAILLVVVLAHQKTQTNTSRQLRLAALTGLLFCLLVGSLPYWSPRLKEKDPTLRLRGWSELANRVQPLRQSQELLIGDERRTVSALAFYLPDNPPFFRYPGPEANIVSQYELWPPPPPGSNALLVLDHLPDPQLANGFAEWHPLGTISVPTGSTERIYYLFRGLDLIHWPRIQIGESR